MVSNKKRLYVALYPSGVVDDAERQYHWAFLDGPKVEKEEDVPGMRYHVKNTIVGGEVKWVYEELDIRNVRMTNTLLARFVIAKIEDEKRLIEVLRSIPVIQKDPGWRCRTWVANALEALRQDGKAVGTALLDWQKIEPAARKYVADKKAAGRYNDVNQMQQARPTFDLIEGKEVLP
ncbi:hypothetical protein CB0940_11960 [Cercospora beticola]|uniref:Uncharacterized protein n=1 Tax=Cercospora beticola TaxID=122368 RepID=A0A2G5ID99_CERBT|nr:hypothetical protein CB0940_11960 [Cercospora beticola]PIB02827.1 hypothetical protein CB0940_11960 [Cercospora beticola]WPB04333.1 hypothetical protein RHO25_008979 [Cercospora beticola]